MSQRLQAKPQAVYVDENDNERDMKTPMTSYQIRKARLFLEGGERKVRDYLDSEAIRSSIARMSMSEEQRGRYNEKARLRQARYR